MKRLNVGTHVTHCCIHHGCKYGDCDCPVENGAYEQEYLCEDCDRDNEDWIDVKEEMPVVPEGRLSISVLVAEFDPVYDEISPGNGYDVHEASTNGEFFFEFHPKEK